MVFEKGNLIQLKHYIDVGIVYDLFAIIFHVIGEASQALILNNIEKLFKLTVLFDISWRV